MPYNLPGDRQPQFVEVVVKATKRKQTIPAHWLEHPSLSEPFTQTPSQRKHEEAANKVAKKTAAKKASAAANDAPATGDKED